MAQEAEQQTKDRARRRDEAKAAAIAALAKPPGITVRTQAPAADQAPVVEAPAAEATAAAGTDDPDVDELDEGEQTQPMAAVPAAGAADDPEPEDAQDEKLLRRREQAAARLAQRREREAEKERASAEKAAARAEAKQAKQERRSGRGSAAPEDDVPEPPSLPGERPRRDARGILATVVVVLGALALICSVLLAVGALLVALGLDEGSGLMGFVTSLADPLVAPGRDLVSFSGENAATKEDFVVYGGGSMIYIGLYFALTALAPRVRGTAS